MTSVRKVLFLTGTRADFGKLKSLMLVLQADPAFDVHVFITGMHMLQKYGSTYLEVERCKFSNVYKYINQNAGDQMDQVLAKTIIGLSDYVRETEPDLILVHGDRVEALAGATVGALSNVLTGHIEGGEVSGTIDEVIRHAVTKMSHVHFVANNAARQRIIQLGEREDAIYVIGSPDVDLMNSDSLPTIDDVRANYEIRFQNYGILMFHPVTTELDTLRDQIRAVIDALLDSGRNYVVIYPNNDHGTEIISGEYERIVDNVHFRLFPSMRFEYFLTLLRHADFIIGNSSAGVREAPHFGVPAVDLGSRQHNRVRSSLVLNIDIGSDNIVPAIERAMLLPRVSERIFGDGNSASYLREILVGGDLWRLSRQKHFIDIC